MRWATYLSEIDETTRLGLLVGDHLHGLDAGTDLLGLLRAGDGALEQAARRAEIDPEESVPFASARLLSPLSVPPSIRDFMSFENHVVTSMAAIGAEVHPVWYEQPVFYFTNPAAVIGPNDDVPIAPGSAQFDFELEVAAVVGTAGRDLTLADAESHIAGYTILCDWSARDLQTREMGIGLGPAKGKDTATGLGPLFVTSDELEPFRSGKGYDLAMSATVNGRAYSSGNWNSIYWSFAQMLVYASRGTELRPGDVIGSGTVGTGCILELERVHGGGRFPWLVDGDVVEIAVEQFGRQRNRIVAGPPVQPLS